MFYDKLPVVGLLSLANALGLGAMFERPYTPNSMRRCRSTKSGRGRGRAYTRKIAKARLHRKNVKRAKAVAKRSGR